MWYVLAVEFHVSAKRNETMYVQGMDEVGNHVS